MKTCSFVRQEATEVETVSMVAPDDRDVLEHPDTFNTTIKIETPSDEETRKKNDVEDKKEEVTASGWEFALTPFEDFPDKLFNFFLFFTGCAISSLLLMVFAITRKLKLINLMAWISGSLALSPLLLIVILDGNIDIISDIRYGYPLYIINSVAIIVVTKKTIKQNAI
ncbi:hypothetical protein HYN59_10210 [Flavobacterium album]|uniref:Uncharacterized protein n=1 Tax=Flavobacterium album TaxID=2175091 RepID=A0A2S1QYH5_9FLAO|nr:hypothetical protein HYN59_10210 [Flavobacterium album]